MWWQYPTQQNPDIRGSSLPFHTLPSVLMTPHASCWSREMLARRWDGIAANLRAAVLGEMRALTHVVRDARQ